MNISVIENKRKQKRITVTELCKAAEIDRTTYYRLLKDPDSMKFSTWNKIVTYLGMTMLERKESLK